MNPVFMLVIQQLSLEINKMINVPFNDLTKHHKSIESEIKEAINQILDSSEFIRGNHVEEFERQFSTLMNAKNCVSCANGTDALYIAVKALGIKDGDEVIVPAHSWISSSEIVSQAGGVVVFCDTKPNEHTIDPNKIRDKITKKTVGIIPVHLFGQAAEMDEIMKSRPTFNGNLGNSHGIY